MVIKGWILVVWVVVVGGVVGAYGQVVFDDEPQPQQPQGQRPPQFGQFQNGNRDRGQGFSIGFGSGSGGNNGNNGFGGGSGGNNGFGNEGNNGFGSGSGGNNGFGNGGNNGFGGGGSGGNNGFGNGGNNGFRGNNGGNNGFGGGSGGNNGFGGGSGGNNGFGGGSGGNNGFGGGSGGNNGFGGNNGGNNGFGNGGNKGFGNGNNGFGNGGSGGNFPESAPNSNPTARQPDCRTFENDGGLCTPLTSCRRISRMLRNSRNAIAAARLLSRSICGLSGIVPNVCCPFSRNNFPDNSLENERDNFNPTVATTPQPRPTFPPTRATLPPTRATFPPTPPPTSTRAPFIIGGGGGGISLVPPKTTTSGGGGGLIIISPTPPTRAEDESLSDVGLPPPQQCGFSNVSHTRIIGGKVAPKGAWPWIAALGYRDENTGELNYLCGGALVSKDFVVTASHCVHKRKDLVTIRFGDHDLFTDGDGVTPIDVGVGEIIQHPKYDPATFYNDIALIRLQKPVPFSAQVHPICLPSSPRLRNNLFQDNTPFVAGWGAIQFNGPSSSALREVQLPIVPDSVCQEKFKSFKSVHVDDTNICAGTAAGGKDACQGDSGGPLMQPVGNSRYVLIGVVSFGFKCAEPGYPGVYSRITSYLPWLERTINF